MKALSNALVAAGLTVLFTTACANDGDMRAERDAQQPQASQQSQPQATSPGTATGTTSAVPAGADAEDRTTQANEPGPGVRHGSNEGGSDRETTAEQPTATPGTGEAIEPNPDEDRLREPESQQQ